MSHWVKILASSLAWVSLQNLQKLDDEGWFGMTLMCLCCWATQTQMKHDYKSTSHWWKQAISFLFHVELLDIWILGISLFVFFSICQCIYFCCFSLVYFPYGWIVSLFVLFFFNLNMFPSFFFFLKHECLSRKFIAPVNLVSAHTWVEVFGKLFSIICFSDHWSVSLILVFTS